MDPNAALTEVRTSLAVVEALIADAEVWEEDARYALGDDGKDAVEALVEHVRALDEWLSKGGFSPAAWTAPQQ